MKGISTVIIAKDEADRIGRTVISALGVTDEVVVFDTGSTDATRSVAEAAGAKVISIDWLGYGPTKNAASMMVANQWILSLDADEVLSAELRNTIQQLEVQADTVYALDRIINFEGQWIHHSGWYPGWVPRLYDRSNAKWNDAKVHEKLEYPANHKQVKLRGQLYHYSFRSMDHFRAKTDEYALLAAKEWISAGSRPSVFKRWIGYRWKYFQMYYLYQGYKDGAAGKTIAKVLADGVKKKLSYYSSLSKGQNP